MFVALDVGGSIVSGWQSLRKGFISNMLNPKFGLFYITFLPQFIPAGVGVVPFSLLLTAIQVVLALAWFAVLVALTTPIGRLLRRPRAVKALDRFTGGVFVAFGAKLALAR
jgi:threonine/homoserine/homoserine lactone efflux protein